MKRRVIGKGRAIGFVILAALLAPACGEAHDRNYIDTYGYYTLDRHEFETEFYANWIQPATGSRYWQHQTELEYGVTDRDSLGLYGIFAQDKALSAWKLENRIRLAEAGVWPVDTAGYLEYRGGVAGKETDEVEAKLIFSKEAGLWNVTANPFLEIENEVGPNGDTKWNSIPGAALALSYRLCPRVTPGIEMILRQNESRVIPGLSISLLPELRFNLGVGIGLVDNADQVQYRSLFEVEF